MATTKVTRRFIKDGAINDAKIGAGAGIATSKLADGADFLKRTGSVALTGDWSAGNNKITNLSAPSAGGDAVNKTALDNAIAGVVSLFTPKGTVRVASTANVTISNPGTSTFDTIVLSNGDRILLKNQTAPAFNGIYIFNGSAVAMSRAEEFNTWAEIPGGWLTVQEGAVNADTIWLSTANAGGTLDTTAITFMQIPTTSSGLIASNFVDNETPSGTVDGSNVTFTIANTPLTGTVHFYINGIRVAVGAGKDYTISGTTITCIEAPETGDELIVDYKK